MTKVVAHSLKLAKAKSAAVTLSALVADSATYKQSLHMLTYLLIIISYVLLTILKFPRRNRAGD